MCSSFIFAVLCTLPFTVFGDYYTLTPLPQSSLKFRERFPLYEAGYRLINAIEDASYPVVYQDKLGNQTPVCDDELSDADATALCVMYGYEYGYRTTYRSKVTLHPNIFGCFSPNYAVFRNYNREFSYFLMDHSCFNATNLVPCAQNQAAAVHCYDYDRIETIEPHVFFISTNNKSWNLHLMIYYLKFGQKHDLFGRGSVHEDVRPTKSSFTTMQCGKEKEPNLKLSKNDKLFQLSGKFVSKCDECVELYFEDQYFYSVCKKV